MDSEGYKTMFGNGLWKIVKGSMIVAKGTKMGTLYLTDNKADLLAVPGATTDPMLWHNRLGHISHKGLQVLASKGLLPKVKSVETDFCENCVLGKQKWVFEGRTRTQDGKARLGAQRCVGTGSGPIFWRVTLLCYLHRRFHQEGMGLLYQAQV
jgi:hypothetical protein